MTNVERWEPVRSRLEDAGYTAEQIEAVRRVGARRRHMQRVDAARCEIRALATRCRRIEAPVDYDDALAILERALADAIVRAAKCAGIPGSRSGTSEPAWIPGSNSAGAWIAAYQHASDDIPAQEYRVTSDGESALILRASDGEWVGAVPLSDSVLAEHMLARQVNRDAAAVDAWLRAHPDGDPPDCLDAAACAALARLIAMRNRERK